MRERTASERSKSAAVAGPALNRGRRPRRSQRPFHELAMDLRVERLEDRMLLSSLSPTQVSALEGGLAAFQTFGGDLAGFSLLGAQLPVLDKSLGQLFDVSTALGADLAQPADAYLGGASPTTSGLVTALNAVTDMGGGVTFTLQSNGTLTFDAPTLSIPTTTTTAVNLGNNALQDNVSAAASATVSTTTTLGLDFSFNLDSSNNFYIDVSSFSLGAAVSSSTLNFAVDFGFIQGAVQNGSMTLAAGATVAFNSADITTSALNAADASPGSLVTVTAASNQNSMTAALPLQFTLGGTVISGTPAPEVDLSDTNLLGGQIPTVTTQNFANLANFSNLTSTSMLNQLGSLGNWLESIRSSSLFNSTIPFTNETVGGALDFGAAFTDKVLSGLVNIDTPIEPPQVNASGGGATGGLLAAGTYFAQYTFVNASGESTPSPASSTFAVTAGEIPTIGLPTAPTGYTINLYLSNSSGGSGSATLYQSAITSTSVNLSQAAGAGAALPTGVKTTPAFATAQELANLVNQATGNAVTAAFDPTTGDLTFAVSLSDTLSPLSVPLSFNLNLGSLASVSTNAQLNITPTVSMGLTFGIDLAPQPAVLAAAAPLPPTLTGSPSQAIPTNGQLGADASFQLLIGSNSPVSISLTQAAMSNITSIVNSANPLDSTTLVGQINLALQAASFNSTNLYAYVVAGYQNANITFTLQKYDQGTSLTIDVPSAATNPMATVLGFTNGQNAAVGTSNTAATLPVPVNGQLGASSSFTLIIGNNNSYNVSVPQSATAGDTSIVNPSNPTDSTTLVGQLNLALQAAGIGSYVTAGYQNSNITFTLTNFTLGPTLQMTFATGDPMGSVLGFVSGQLVHAEAGGLFVQNFTADASLGLSITNSGSGPFASASVGPVSISINQGSFSASGDLSLEINQGNPISLSTLISDLSSISGIESVVSITPAITLTGSLTGLQVSAGGFLSINPSPAPSITATALDPLSPVNELTVPASPGGGQLSGDLYFEATIAGQAAVPIHIPQSATSSNGSIADLVNEINQALQTAGVGTMITAAVDAQNASQIDFNPGSSLPAGTAFTVDDFLLVQYQNFGQLLNLGSLNIGQIANLIASAVNGLSQYSDLGFLNDTLPIINLSLVNLVNYGATLANDFQQIQSNPSATLQQFANQIATIVGLPSGDLLFSYDQANQALEIKLVYQTTYDQYLPLNLNLASLAADAGGQAATFLQGITSLVDLTGRSRIQVQAGATVTLDMGIGFASGTPSAFLYNDTGVGATLLLTAANSNFSAAIGPLSLSVNNGSAVLSADGSSTTNPASFTIGLQPSLGNPSLSSFLSNISSDVTSTLTAGAGVSLPLYLQGTQSLGTVAITIPSVAQLFASPVPAGAVQITTPNLAQELSQVFSLSSLLENPSVFLDPLNSLLTELQGLLNNNVLNANIPLVGSALSGASDFFGVVQSDIVSPLDQIVKSGGGNPAQSMASAITSALGSILVTPATVTNPDVNSVQFNLDMGQTFTFDVPFNLGLSALGLSLSGDVQVTLSWSVYLDFGVSTQDGFYVVTDPTNLSGATVPVANVGVSVGIPGLSFNGSLAFLDLSAADNAANPTNLSGAFSVGLNSPQSDGRLTIDQISAGPLSSLYNASFTGNAHVDLNVVASVGSSGMFPSFSFEFVLNWNFADWQINGPNAGGSNEGSTPQIAFDNVSLSLGTFISNFVGPIFSDIQPILNDIQPVITILTEPLPVISQLAGQSISLISIAEALEPQYAPDINAFLSMYNLFYSLVNEVSSVGSGNIVINFGDFSVNSLIGDIRGMSSLSTAPINTANLPSFTSLSSQLTTQGASSEQQGFTHSITGGSIQFPILDNPASIFELLMGQTVNLMTFNTPTLAFGFSYNQVFPIFGPLAATLGGNVSASIQFQFGYDTYGIQEFAHADFAPSAIPDLFDGFYAVTNGAPNVVLNAGITAGAAISIGVASAGVEGGIFATVDMSLFDPSGTGKLRLNTFIHELETDPLQIFTVSGQVYAQLFAYIDINLFLFSINDTFNITPPITLVTFNYTPHPTPTLATVSSNGTLTLQTGPDASNRGVGNTNDGDESVTVTDAGGTAGNETVNVSSMGYTTTYTGVSTITANMGLGNDYINLSGVTSNTVISGGEGNNTIIGGSGYNTIVETGFSSYNLTGGVLQMGPNSSDTFQNIQDVQITGQASGDTTFNVTNYVGNSTLQGQGNGNTYNVNLSPDGTTTIQNTGSGDTANIVLGQGSSPVTITPTTVTQGVNTVVFGSSVTTLTVTGTASNTPYTIQNTPGSATTTTLNTGDGNDVVNVQNTSGPTTVSAGAGTDVVNVGSQSPAGSGPPPTPGSTVGGIQGALTVTTQIGVVTLNVDDSSDTRPQAALLTNVSLVGLGMGSGGITYSNLTNVNLYLGTGGDAVSVQSTAQYTLSTLIAASGSAANTFDVGSLAPLLSGGVVANILGPIVIQGSGLDTLSVDDSGDTTAQSAVLTNNSLNGLGMVVGGISYTGLADLNVKLGTGGDTFNIQSTYTATTTTLVAQTSGSAANTYNVGSLAPTLSGGVVSGIAGPLIIQGSGADTLNVDDTGDTTARSNTTLTDTTLNGLGMGAGGITFTQVNPTAGTSSLHSLTINLGLGGNTNFTINVDLNLPYLTTVAAGTVNDTATVTYQHNANGVLNLIGFHVSGGETVNGNLSGLLNETQFQNVPLLTINGNVLPTGEIIGVNIQHLVVDGIFAGLLNLTGNLGQMDVTGDLSGQLQIGGTLSTLNVLGGTPGSITASRVGDIAVQGGYGPIVLQVNENGTQRRVEAAVPGTPYPLPIAAPPNTPYPTSESTNANPAGVNFQYLYEGLTAVSASGQPLSLANPQLTVRIANNSGSYAPDQYDLSLVTWSDTQKFNLARVDSVNPSGIRDVSVEGNLLTQISTEAQLFLGLPNTRGGVVLPQDQLASVAVRDFAPPASIDAQSVQAVAFGEYLQPNGTLAPGNTANYTDAGELLTPGTAVAIGDGTFRIPFATQYDSAMFLGVLPNQNIFGPQDILFVDQQPSSGVSSDPRGGVTALVTAVLVPVGSTRAFATRVRPLFTRSPSTMEASIASVALNGIGGSIQTGLPITQSITSTGPLGELLLSGPTGLAANVTAPTIFGGILAPRGPITGSITTTGIEYDPITGAPSTVDGSIGSLSNAGTWSAAVTEILAGNGAISGTISSTSKIVSLVQANGSITGLIVAQGDIGVESANAIGLPTLYGGIVSHGPITGQIVTQGNLVGDLTAYGGLSGGRIIAQGSILGNVVIDARFTPQSAIVSGGSIGGTSPTTYLTLPLSSIQGFVAAVGSIAFKPHSGTQPSSQIFQNLSSGSPAATAVDALFSQVDQDILNDALTELALDVYGLSDQNGNLSYTRPV